MTAKPRSTEVYGFVLWVTAFVSYLAFLLWAFLPEHVLQSVGVTYYPSKWWAVAIPMYICTTLVFVVIVYAAYNLYSTNPLDSLSTITDSYARAMPPLEKRAIGAADVDFSIPEISDIPADAISKLLYAARPAAPEHRTFGAGAGGAPGSTVGLAGVGGSLLPGAGLGGTGSGLGLSGGSGSVVGSGSLTDSSAFYAGAGPPMGLYQRRDLAE
jgi:phosphatidylinositol glycan class P protein